MTSEEDPPMRSLEDALLEPCWSATSRRWSLLHSSESVAVFAAVDVVASDDCHHVTTKSRIERDY